MTARAFAVKWVGCGERGDVEMVCAEVDSERSEARATAPKPLAQRRSISRRVRGRGMKRLQCIFFFKGGTGASRVAREEHGRGAHATFSSSIQENELLHVDQHVTEIVPWLYRIGVLLLLFT